MKIINEVVNEDIIIDTDKVIVVNNLTKAYKKSKGIFDVSFTVKTGEVFGYLGPNGAGKTTTIRHLMGFIKANSGTAQILGKNVWTETSLVQRDLGYLPGELTLPEELTGIEFIKYIFKLRNQDNWDQVEKLIEYWEFDPTIKIKKMSKGMKQKVGIVLAFMHNPKILILDEPTSGLDPLMQDKFVKLIQKNKLAGNTVIMSTHIFQEIEKTCDRVAIIRSGRIVSTIDMNEQKDGISKKYKIQFKDKWSENAISSAKIIQKSDDGKTISFEVEKTKINVFLTTVATKEIELFEEIKFDLEEHFMDFYRKEKEVNEDVN